MRDLLVVTKLPQTGQSKTRLGSEIGYDKSAALARFLLENIVNQASNCCRVTIVAHNSQAARFKEEFPSWVVYASKSDSMLLKIADAVKETYSASDSGQVVTITSDLYVTEAEIDSWFNRLDRLNLLIGCSRGLELFLAGMHDDFGHQLASQLSNVPTYLNFTYGCIKSLASLIPGRINKIGVLPPKQDIDTLKDLCGVLPSITDVAAKKHVTSLINPQGVEWARSDLNRGPPPYQTRLQ